MPRPTAGWSVRGHRVEARADAMCVHVFVDGVDQKQSISNRVLGEWPVRVGDNTATLKRVRNVDVARSELVFDEIVIPPSAEHLERGKPPLGARCRRHSAAAKQTEDYRKSAAPRAEATCGACGAGICDECTAADGVRCTRCFEAATKEMAENIRAGRSLGVTLGLSVGLIVAVFGLVVQSGTVLGVGLAALVLVAAKVIEGKIREKRGT